MNYYGYDIGSGWNGLVDEETNTFMKFATEEEYDEYLEDSEN